LTLRKDGQWVKRKGKLTIYFGKDRLVAERRYAEWLKSEEQPAAGSTTLETLRRSVLDHKISEGVGSSSIAGYRREIDRLIDHFGGARRVDTISVAEWANHRDRLGDGVALSTAASRVIRLRAVLSYAVDRGWIEPSQFKVLRRPRAAALRREKASRGSQ